MKTTIKLEEAMKFAAAWILSYQFGFSWWVFLAWLLAPDISIVAYGFGTKIGAWIYNLFHHQGVAIIVGLIGVYLVNIEMQFAGTLLFGHSSMDRLFGYGLKFEDSFKNTHLGWIG